MRRSTSACLMACLITVGAGQLAVAQEEALDEDAVGQRVEVSEAGVAITFPADWSVDIEMRQREDFGLIDDPDGEPVVFWQVLYASAGGRPWCDVTWYPEHPMALADHALLFEELMTPGSDVERTIEVSGVALPVGEAYRFDIHNGPSDDFSTTYLVGSSSSRYILECMADTRDEDDWLQVAETMELAETISTEQPASSLESGLERVEVPETGIAMALPEDWSVIVQMVRREAELPPELSDSGSVDFRSVIEGTWLQLGQSGEGR